VFLDIKRINHWRVGIVLGGGGEGGWVVGRGGGGGGGGGGGCDPNLPI
jgi:hypothetical protein